MDILLLEPYYTGSHRAWADGFAGRSAHQITVVSLPGRWWKWRMHGGAVTLARLADAWCRQRQQRPDLLLATDMLDLTTFLALSRTWSAGLPVALYMHENQLTYPLPADATVGPMRRQGGERDLHYAFINYASMLAADAIFFNSRYHLDAWFSALPNLLKHFPDFAELATVAALRARSSVLPLGLDLARFDLTAPSSYLQPIPGSAASRPPIILWNHRWEYDKDPDTFFRALDHLVDRGVPFRVALCGESFARTPAVFNQARHQLGDRVLQWGHLASWEAYASLVRAADIVVSTAQHDFFGAAVVEAIYCGCRPVLPNRLAYPEHIPAEAQPRCLYQDFDGLLERLIEAIAEPELDLRHAVARYDWSEMAPRYDAALTRLVRPG